MYIKLRSTFLIVSVFSLLLLLLAACGGSSSEAPAAPKAAAPAAAAAPSVKAVATPTNTPFPIVPDAAPRPDPTPIPTSTPVPDWKTKWDAVVARACEEGEVLLQGPAEVRERTLFTEIFAKEYPCIKVKYSGIRARSWLPKIEAERKANVYNWDLYLVSGATSGRTGWKAGYYDKLRPWLILPEVVDESKWRGGFADGWLDTDKGYLYNVVEGTNTLNIQVNTDKVPASAVSKLEDLLKPEFTGKILSDDPRARGPGNGANSTLYASFGEPFLRKLWEGQEVSISKDVRALLEQLIRGQASVGIALDGPLPAFQAEGIGKNVVNKELTVPIALTSGARGQVALIKNAPHPNAAAVVANWYMTQKIQQLHVDRYKADKESRVSRRLDVTSYCANGTDSCIPKAGQTYVNYDKEENASIRNEARDIAKSIFGK